MEAVDIELTKKDVQVIYELMNVIGNHCGFRPMKRKKMRVGAVDIAHVFIFEAIIPINRRLSREFWLDDEIDSLLKQAYKMMDKGEKVSLNVSDGLLLLSFDDDSSIKRRIGSCSNCNYPKTLKLDSFYDRYKIDKCPEKLLKIKNDDTLVELNHEKAKLVITHGEDGNYFSMPIGIWTKSLKVGERFNSVLFDSDYFMSILKAIYKLDKKAVIYLDLRDTFPCRIRTKIGAITIQFFLAPRIKEQ